MGKHRHKKSFYDVDEDELESFRKHHHHRRHRRHHSNDQSNETKQRVPSISSFHHSKLDEDDVALSSPPMKRQRSSSSSNHSQSPSKILSQIIEDPEFLANAGPKAKEFVETARQLLSKPDLDSTTQQIICAMAQAAVNVGKKLNSVGSTPSDQCVDDISIANSTTYPSSTLLSPTLSTTSSSSTSTISQQQQQQSHSIPSRDENRTPNEPESNEDILIKQMIERAMKLTQQGDTRHAQHLLGVIHEKLSNKRKRAAAAEEEEATINSNEHEKMKNSSSDDFYSLPSVFNEDSQNSNHKISPSESEQSNDYYQTTTCFSYPPPPPLPPPPPPPPLPDADPTTSPTIPVPCIEQVQELLSNPSEVQDILKKLFGANETARVSPPEEYQMQSHLTSSPSFPTPSLTAAVPFNTTSIYPPPSTLRVPQPPLISPPAAALTDPQPYNSSLAFMQGNRRNLPPLQTPDRCFSSSSSSTTKITKPPSNRSFSSSSSLLSSTVNNGILPSLANPPLSAPPLMKVNPTFPYASVASTISEPIPSRWTANPDQQRHFQPFWCATCALGFPHQIAYQDHLRSHISCNVNGCSYTASEPVVRLHRQDIHENTPRNRLLHSIRPITQARPSLEQPWPLMRM